MSGAQPQPPLSPKPRKGIFFLKNKRSQEEGGREGSAAGGEEGGCCAMYVGRVTELSEPLGRNFLTDLMSLTVFADLMISSVEFFSKVHKFSKVITNQLYVHHIFIFDRLDKLVS